MKVSHLQAGEPTTQVDITQMNNIEVTMFNQIMNTRSQQHANINHKLNYIEHLARIEYRQKGRRRYERIILMRSGDIELNPGPEDGVSRCHTCSKNLRAGTFLTCGGCGRTSHKQEKCSNTKKGESKEAWRCTDCREAEREQDLCRECGHRVRQGNTMLKCAGCGDSVHKKEECSKIKRNRRERINLDKWNCMKCANPERYLREQEKERRRMEETGTKEKKKCNICRKAIRANKNDRACLRCTRCKKDVHLKQECSGETREATKKLDREKWICITCTEIEEEQGKRRTGRRSDEGETREMEYITSGKTSKTALRVLQWNADSIMSKKDEFKTVINDNKVDVFLIQETKMTAMDKIPSIPGYTVLSKPRKQARGNEKNRGGGLITGIRNTIPYREVEDLDIRDEGDDITEWITIEIPLSNKKRWRISNIYIPSERAGDCRESNANTVVSTKYWPCGQDDLLAGDLNAHSIIWDDALEEEGGQRGLEIKRGEKIEEWLEDKMMAVLNNGKGTHTNRRTGKESTPDVTVVHSSQADTYEWEILEELGGSDHKPILITREAEGVDKVNDKYVYNWDLKGGDFAAFREEFDQELPVNYEKKQIHKLEKIFKKVFDRTANKHIGTKKTNKDSKPAMTSTIKAKIRERNELRRRFGEPGGREKWINKCREVKEEIKKEKELRWREYVDELDTKTNCKQVWKTIRNLDGRVTQRKENEVLVVEGKAYVEDKEKAKQFAKVYKKVSKIRKGPRDRTIKRQNRKFLSAGPTGKSKYESDITWEELERIISETKTNKAPGEDTIPYDVIKELGPKAKKFILHMYNRIWDGEPIPQRWRTAVIKPLLKEGKDPKSPGSWRPISLTACLGKILEKIIADRLSAFMEENYLLNENQAGFRKERCTTDQVLKLVQMASDKMQENKDGAATVVTFFDFSRAYDKVWREGLLSKMIKLGVPYKFVKYARLFLSARKTMVEINGTRSNEFYLNEGLPQGSAISPLLFLLFINDITDFTKEGAMPSLFADDTAIWIMGGKDREKTVKDMQNNIDGISRWADEWKMELNGDKTQAMVISTSSKDTSWKPPLFLNGVKLEVVKEYKFLGVIIDNGLRFTAHVNKVVAKCTRRNGILKCLAGKEWGQNLETQKALYATYVRSAMEYASPSWYPWISETQRKKLEKVQNESMRIMTRMARTTPIDFLRLEAGLEPINSRLEKNSQVMWERYKRLRQEDNRRVMAEKEVKRRLKSRVGWRHGMNEMVREEYNREMPVARVDPMTPLHIVVTGVELEKSKDCYTEEQLRQLTEAKIIEVDADVEIFTDGSTSEDQRKEGAGIFAQDKNGNTLLEECKAAGKLCSSYDGESVAALAAVEWIEEKPVDGKKYAIFTDSLSLVSALKSNKWKDTHEWIRAIKCVLQRAKRTITICWVPSHCGTYGNEIADKLADQGSTMDQSSAPVTENIVRAKIRNRKWKVEHERAAKMYGERRKPKEIEKSWPANTRRLYARIRSDHAKELRCYQKKIDMVSQGICIYCDMDEEETVEHVLCKCPQLEVARRTI